MKNNQYSDYEYGPNYLKNDSMIESETGTNANS